LHVQVAFHVAGMESRIGQEGRTNHLAKNGSISARFVDIADEIGINDAHARAAVGDDFDDAFTLQLLERFANGNGAGFISSCQFGDLEAGSLLELSRDDVPPYEIPETTITVWACFCGYEIDDGSHIIASYLYTLPSENGRSELHYSDERPRREDVE
jgi:hypothetical protein